MPLGRAGAGSGAAFGELAALAAMLCGTDAAAIFLFGEGKLRQVAGHGVAAGSGHAGRLCADIAASGKRLELLGTEPDGTPGGFFAGEPVILRGTIIGALCVHQPRPRGDALGAAQARALRSIAGRVAAEVALHRAEAAAQAAAAPRPNILLGWREAERLDRPVPLLPEGGRNAWAEQEALLAAQRRFAQGLHTEAEIWQAVADISLHVVRAAQGACVAVPEDDVLVSRAVAGTMPPDIRTPLRGSLSGLCLREGIALRTGEAQSDPRTGTASNVAAGIHSGIAVPIPKRGSFVGVLRLVSAAPNAFSERDMALAQILASIIGTGLGGLDEERARHAALEADARLRLMADAVPGIIWQSDAEGRVDFLNRRWTEFTGIPVDQALDEQRWLDMLHPEDRAATLAAWTRARDEGGEYRISHRQLRRDGSYRWLLTIGLPYHDPMTGRLRRWFGSSVDVHDELEAQATVRRLNAELEKLIAERTQERDQVWNSSTDMLCVITLEGRLTSVNPAWTAVLGWEEGALRNRDVLDLTHPEDRSAGLATLEALRQGRPQFNRINRMCHRDGGHRWLSWNAAVAGNRIYATARDITAEREREEARMQLEEQLRQSQKMEAVGQLTGGLAHDFNNLLTGVIGSLDLLEARLGTDGRSMELDRYLMAARGSAERAAALTHRLLAFSRRQTLDPRPTRPDALAAGMEELVRRTVGPAIELQLRHEAESWTTLCDPNQLESALLNLCINARDAMPAGGRLVIATANRRLDGRAARLLDLAPGCYVMLEVADTGEGMPREVSARAFDPFFTTKPIGKGTGLGLSMVYGFARQSGGRAVINSQPGQGTTVSLYLPRHLGAEDAPEEEMPAGEPDPAEAADGSVLIVEDEPTIRMLVREVVRGMGLAVLESADATAALALLQSPRRIDLLLTDVGLPGSLNGRQLADAARAARPSIKVLFITGYTEEAALRGDALAPGMAVLTKPFSMEELASRVRRMLAEGF
ncbi:PAS domain S-box protein [Teichococcus oryzae]|uniref:PAS domain S-box protein n=1 Tax=Teichococcus oryzae TaxID=1608942 RepID=UPI001375F5BA|nr:PAS domain S-box protein [Pseudoroseomonas oryzae]